MLDVVVTTDVSAAREAGGCVQIHPGGSAANFAVGASRARASVRFVGRAGDDVAGRLLVGELEREGVSACVRVVPDAPTGHVLVMRDPDGTTRMIAEPGASRTLHPDDLAPDWFEELDAVHVTGYSLMREGPAPAARAAVRAARARSPRALLSFDPAPAYLVRSYGPERLRDDIRELGFDLIFPNLEEGLTLAQAEDPEAAARALAPLARVVVLKLGERGCLVAHGGSVAHVPAVVGPVVDVTGAGDAFAAAFVVAYVRTRDPLAAAGAGAEAATRVIGRVGAR